jgi:hypothetical protein
MDTLDFSERDQEIINSAEKLGSFEVLITDNKVSATISGEARELLDFLKSEYGITFDKPSIDFCG